MAVTMKNAVFWDVTPCGSGQQFLVTPNVFLACRLFHPDDGGETFLRNVGSHKSHTASSQKTALFISDCVYHF
jgi:hypothetical protein